MIRFPRMHVAKSVMNRIANAQNDVQVQQNAPPSMPAFNVQGAMLDQALAQPPSDDMASIDGIEQLIPAKALDL